MNGVSLFIAGLLISGSASSMVLPSESSAFTLRISADDYRETEKRFLASLTDDFVARQSFEPGHGRNSHANPDALSEAQLKALYAYGNSDCVTINAALRHEDVDRLSVLSVPIEHLEDEIVIARRALTKIVDYEGTLFRGAHLPEKFLDAHRVGQTVCYDGLTSTSRDVQVAKDFAGDHQLLVIHSVHGKPIRDYVSTFEEDEVLFDHHTCFRVMERGKSHSRLFASPIDRPIRGVTDPDDTPNFEIISMDEISSPESISMKFEPQSRKHPEHAFNEYIAFINISFKNILKRVFPIS